MTIPKCTLEKYSFILQKFTGFCIIPTVFFNSRSSLFLIKPLIFNALLRNRFFLDLCDSSLTLYFQRLVWKNCFIH